MRRFTAMAVSMAIFFIFSTVLLFFTAVAVNIGFILLRIVSVIMFLFTIFGTVHH